MEISWATEAYRHYLLFYMIIDLLCPKEVAPFATTCFDCFKHGTPFRADWKHTHIYTHTKKKNVCPIQGPNLVPQTFNKFITIIVFVAVAFLFHLPHSLSCSLPLTPLHIASLFGCFIDASAIALCVWNVKS